jgi:hypothetical protein
MMDPFARKMWAAGIWFAISLIVLVVGLKVFSMHQWPTCPDRVISEAANPGKTWVAAILQRRCGPESEFSTRVNVRPAGPLHTGFFSSQAAKGNVFVLREDAAGAKISVSWAANNLLRVRCLHCPASLIGQRDQAWGDVKIEYEFP